MLEFYKISYQELKKITKEYNRFPMVQEWNHFAKSKELLCHASLEYVSTLDWNYLRVKVLRELNMKV